MKKYTLLSLLSICVAVILMIFPIGAILRFAPSSTKMVFKFFSYFDMTVWGYGNMFPFLTAVLSISSLILLFCVLLSKSRNPMLNKTTLICSIICTCTSILALLFFIVFGTVSVASVFISILLLSTTAMQFVSKKREKRNQTNN